MLIKEKNKQPITKEINHREHTLLTVGVIPENIIYKLVSGNYDIGNTILEVETSKQIVTIEVYPRKVGFKSK